jgi:hypothetical protein
MVEGPLQYDAAIDPTVASVKIKTASEVAGKATVFVFPDLNTGNNTYKAVQQVRLGLRGLACTSNRAECVVQTRGTGACYLPTHDRPQLAALAVLLFCLFASYWYCRQQMWLALAPNFAACCLLPHGKTKPAELAVLLLVLSESHW